MRPVADFEVVSSKPTKVRSVYLIIFADHLAVLAYQYTQSGNKQTHTVYVPVMRFISNDYFNFFSHLLIIKTLTQVFVFTVYTENKLLFMELG